MIALERIKRLLIADLNFLKFIAVIRHQSPTLKVFSRSLSMRFSVKMKKIYIYVVFFSQFQQSPNFKSQNLIKIAENI